MKLAVESPAPLVSFNFEDEEPDLRMVLIYETALSGRLGMQLYHSLVEQLEERLHFRQDLWKFDLLRSSDLRDLASEQAATADLVVLACRNDEKLPPYIRQWVKGWLSLKTSRPTALVVLLHHDSAGVEANDELRSYLEDIIAGQNVDLFIRSIEIPEKHLSPPPTNGSHEGSAPTRALRDLLAACDPQPRWGINE